MKLVRDRYPGYYSRDFLLLAGLLHAPSLPISLMISPLSRLLGSLLSWDLRSLPDILRRQAGPPLEKPLEQLLAL